MPDTNFPLQAVSSPSRLARGLDGDPQILSILYTETKSALIASARRIAREFPPDLLEEAVSEMWLMVCAAGSAPVRRAGLSDIGFLTVSLRHAVRRVRANNRPAGAPSRGEFEVQGIEFDPENQTHVEAEQRVANEEFERYDVALETFLDLDRALSEASAPVRQAASLMLLRDVSISEAANLVGLNRMTLTRAFKALGKAA